MRKSPLENVLSSWHKLIEDFGASSKTFYASVEDGLRRREIPGLKTQRIIWNEGGVLCPKREYLRMTDGRIAFDLCAAPFGTGFFFSWWLVKRPASWVFLYFLAFGLLLRLIHHQIVSLLFLVSDAARTAVMLGSPTEPTTLRRIYWGVSHSWVFWSPSWLERLFPRGIAADLAMWLLAILGVFAGVSFLARLGRIGPESAMMSIPLARSAYGRLFAPVTYYQLDTALMLRSAVHAAVLEAIDGLTAAKGLRALTQDERKPIMRELVEGMAKGEPLPIGAD